MIKPITVRLKFTREYIKEHPQWTFVYSADYFMKGVLGQMWFAHGEPNAYPVIVCKQLCPGKPDKYFFDGVPLHKQWVDESLAKIPTDKPIIPFRKIGEGASMMNRTAPQLFSYLRNRLKELQYQNIIINYNEQDL